MAGTLTGGQGNDSINLSNVVLAASSLQGNEGVDILSIATSTGTTVQGGQGNDTINIGVAGTSTSTQGYFNGNKGVDIVQVKGTLTSSTVRGGQGSDIINVENLTFTNVYGDLGNDTITATGVFTDSTVFGGEGDDTLAGDAKSVELFGEAGNDGITGSSAVDTLNGGDGNDTLTGKDGADQLTGGAGNDRFSYENTAQTGAVATGVIDVITDFTSTKDSIGGFGAGTIGAGKFAAVPDAAVANDSTYADALADANAIFSAPLATQNYVLSAYGTTGSFTAVLFIDIDGVPSAATGAIQIGNKGAYATAAQALDALVAGDIVA